MLSGKEQLDKNWRSLKIVFQLGLQDTKLSYIIITKYYRFCFGVKNVQYQGVTERAINDSAGIGLIIRGKHAHGPE